MKIVSTNNTGFGATLKVPALQKVTNRRLLQSSHSGLKALGGPDEAKKAKVIVGVHVAENAGIAAAMAQLPGFDEIALSANEVKMAMEIYNGVYDFKFNETTLKSLLGALAANRVGAWMFKGASKLFSWIPAVGNGLNATIAGGTTATLGAAIISNAEAMDKIRQNSQQNGDMIKRIEDFIKKMDE